VIWIKSPLSQIAAICENFRSSKENVAAQCNREPFSRVDEASAATLEPLRLINKAVRACDGEAFDVEK